MVRKIKVQGTKATYLANKYDPINRRVDFGKHLDVIASSVKDLVSADKPRLIGVAGLSGSGKTGLSKVLEHDGNNVTVIDVCSLRNQFESRLTDITDHLRDTTATYVVDELAFAEHNCYPIIEEHVEQGGIVVFMVQHQSQIELKTEICWLSMDRKGIKPL